MRQRYLYLTGGKDLVVLFSLCPLNGGFTRPIEPRSAMDDDERDRIAYLLDNEPQATKVQLSQEPAFKRTAVQDESPSVPAVAERRPRRAFQFPSSSDAPATSPRATSATVSSLPVLTTSTTTTPAADTSLCVATEPVSLAFPRAHTPVVQLPPYPGAASLMPNLYPPVHSSAAYAVGTAPIPQVPAIWQQQAPPGQGMSRGSELDTSCRCGRVKRDHCYICLSDSITYASVCVSRPVDGRGRPVWR